jgi:hypothetical protein
MKHDLTEFMIFGPQPPVPGYFSRIALEMQADDRLIDKLHHMHAMMRLADVLEICEAA